MKALLAFILITIISITCAAQPASVTAILQWRVIERQGPYVKYVTTRDTLEVLYNHKGIGAIWRARIYNRRWVGIEQFYTEFTAAKRKMYYSDMWQETNDTSYDTIDAVIKMFRYYGK